MLHQCKLNLMRILNKIIRRKLFLLNQIKYIRNDDEDLYPVIIKYELLEKLYYGLKKSFYNLLSIQFIFHTFMSFYNNIFHNMFFLFNKLYLKNQSIKFFFYCKFNTQTTLFFFFKFYV